MSPPAFPITPEGLKGAWTFNAIEAAGPFDGRGLRRHAVRRRPQGRAQLRLPGAGAAARRSPTCPTTPRRRASATTAMAAMDGVDVLIDDAQFLGPRAPARRRLRPRDHRRGRHPGRDGERQVAGAVPPRTAPHRRRAGPDRASSSAASASPASPTRAWSSTCPDRAHARRTQSHADARPCRGDCSARAHPGRVGPALPAAPLRLARARRAPRPTSSRCAATSPTWSTRSRSTSSRSSWAST